ncbi:MAG: TIM barrel protein [Polyangiaceae bacterium]|jgi:sugar phosphate isomerase/epimerase
MSRHLLSLDPGTLGFHLPFHNFAGHAAAAGFDGIESPCKDARAFGSPSALRAFLDGHGLDSKIHSCPWALPANGAVPESVFLARLEAIPEIARFARDSGADALSVFLRCSAEGMARLSLEQVVARIGALASAAGETAITVELNDPTYLRQAATIVQSVPNCRLLVDVFHVIRSGLDATWIASLPRNAIGWVHLSDAGAEIYERRPDDVPREMPGDGVLPLRELIAAIEETGYLGPFSVEVLNDRLLCGDPADIAREAFDKARRAVP